MKNDSLDWSPVDDGPVFKDITPKALEPALVFIRVLFEWVFRVDDTEQVLIRFCAVANHLGGQRMSSVINPPSVAMRLNCGERWVRMVYDNFEADFKRSFPGEKTYGRSNDRARLINAWLNPLNKWSRGLSDKELRENREWYKVALMPVKQVIERVYDEN